MMSDLIERFTIDAIQTIRQSIKDNEFREAYDIISYQPRLVYSAEQRKYNLLDYFIKNGIDDTHQNTYRLKVFKLLIKHSVISLDIKEGELPITHRLIIEYHLRPRTEVKQV